jgi:peptide/nickel transport system substrate-binding protein
MKRLVVSAVMMALGVAFGATAYAVPEAEATPGLRIKHGGTFRISQWADIQYVDPALSVATAEWPYLDATCAKLMNYPDRPAPAGLRAVPEVASRYTVGAQGRMYRFTLRPAFRFSDGEKLTAENFVTAIERVLDPKMQSLAVDSGYFREIVGADDVLSGKSPTPSGVVARGNTLTIRLTKPVPDFVARLAMPYFCAVPRDLPHDPEGVKSYASAGPYYIAAFQRGRRLVIKKNPNYRGRRKRHVNAFVVDTALSRAEMVRRIERGEADWGLMDLRARQESGQALLRRYRSRLVMRPSWILRFLVLNSERPLFRDNAPLRRAVNYAINRVSLAGAAGRLSIQPSDQYLPIGFRGFKDAHIYRLNGNVRRARALARGRLRGGKAVLYTVEGPLGQTTAQIVQRNLARIGLRVEVKTFPFGTLFAKLFTPGEPFDIANNPGFGADYADPATFLNVNFAGWQWAHFKSPKFNRRMNRAARLSGAKRYRAYRDLDIALARDAAPLVPYGTDNEWTFTSKRVGCKILRPALDLAAVCLKN